MERLTSENSFCLDCDYIGVCKADCQGKKVYDKLKVYEDLGFTPEDIACMAKFYKEHTSVEAILDNMRIVKILLEAKRKEAYWIPSQKCTVCTWEEVTYVDGYECSECGRFEEEKEPYCNCGCKMVEVT